MRTPDPLTAASKDKADAAWAQGRHRDRDHHGREEPGCRECEVLAAHVERTAAQVALLAPLSPEFTDQADALFTEQDGLMRRLADG